jgi:hypothetical protein
MAGGDDQRTYPWGAADPGTQNEYAIFGCHYPGTSPCRGDATNIAPVGSAPFGAGRWGQLDLTGEMLVFSIDAYAPYVTPCVDCANFIEGMYPTRILRGADFGAAASQLPPTQVTLTPASEALQNDGIRCAR